jgi:DNA-binding CsgD family transcriptional regulator
MASIVDLLIWTRSWDRPVVRTAAVRHDHVLLRSTHSAAEAFFSGGLLIAFVADPDDRHQPRSDAVTKAYGLTQGERKLVEALADGLRVNEIATRHDVSVETVRSQLLGKMGSAWSGQCRALTSTMAYLRALPGHPAPRAAPIR